MKHFITVERVVHLVIGISALASLENIASFFLRLGHPFGAAWATSGVLGIGLVVVAVVLTQVDPDTHPREFRWVLGLASALALLSGGLQTSGYSHTGVTLPWNFVLGFSIPILGEVVLPWTLSRVKSILDGRTLLSRQKSVEEELRTKEQKDRSLKEKRQREADEFVYAQSKDVVHTLSLLNSLLTNDGLGIPEDLLREFRSYRDRLVKKLLPDVLSEWSGITLPEEPIQPAVPPVEIHPFPFVTNGHHPEKAPVVVPSVGPEVGSKWKSRVGVTWTLIQISEEGVGTLERDGAGTIQEVSLDTLSQKYTRL